MFLLTNSCFIVFFKKLGRYGVLGKKKVDTGRETHNTSPQFYGTCGDVLRLFGGGDWGDSLQVLYLLSGNMCSL